MKKPGIIACLESVCISLLDKKEELNELDAVMGDGEHGSNIERTFGKVLKTIPEMSELDGDAIIDKTGSVLLAAGGGTATTLMGFACKKTAVQMKKQEIKNAGQLAEIMEKTWESILAKSKAEVGDKTLMDAYTPAVEAFGESARNGKTMKHCFEDAAAAAEKGVEATKNMIAKRGRGYYVGERGLGVADPGATSVAVIFRAIANTLNEGE